MIAYNSVQDYQNVKEFEAYLLIKQRIEHECKRGVQELLSLLKSVYCSGGKEEDLMQVLRGARK